MFIVSTVDQLTLLYMLSNINARKFPCLEWVCVSLLAPGSSIPLSLLMNAMELIEGM